MKQTLKRTILTGATLGLLLSPIAVSARDGETEGDDVRAETSSYSPSPSAEPSETPRPERVRKLEESLRKQLEQKRHEREKHAEHENETEIETHKARLAEKLDAAKRKTCANHEATINRLMSVMDKRRDNAISRISQISTAVQDFYAKKHLNVANYSELLANVAAAKAVAEQAVSEQKAIPDMKCDGEHPRADVADFKAKKEAAKDAVKAYRDAVKALIQAVKAATETTETTSPSPSPEAQS